MRLIGLWLLCLSTFLPINFAVAEQNIEVRFHETYELANIILALTEYGKADKNEVNKKTGYYREVLAYFEQYADHPLLKKVNYSRKEWDKLLSFRTDAAAFELNEAGELFRKVKFYAMGKKINEFEEHLKLIEDFVNKSKFRAFYKSKYSFYIHLEHLYQQSLMIPEITDFLQTEFNNNIDTKFSIVVSPLVGRMHCQRFFNGASTSFINIPDYLYDVKELSEINSSDIASGIHMFFTEIDHAYVNQATKKYKKFCMANFNQNKWDNESGYGSIKNGVFNEYMTWAVYDLFIVKHFSDQGAKAIKDWHSVNTSRGFFAFPFFSVKLQQLYVNKKQGEIIYDLYPKLLEWCKSVEDDLEKIEIN